MTNIRLQDHSRSYQYHLPLDYTVKFDEMIPKDDITRTVCDAVINAELIRYINTRDRDAHGYDSIKMLMCVMLAMTLYGYASVRDLSEFCKYDARFIFITNGACPSFMAFERFIKDDLTDSIEDIFHALNRWIQKEDTEMNPSVLTIDGTKYEANANKMTFVWMGGTKKYQIKCWKKSMKKLQELNLYCTENQISTRFSILCKMDLNYLMSVCDSISNIMEDQNIEMITGKGKRKSELQRFYEEFRDDAIKMWKYQMHFDIAGDRNSFSKTDPDATFMHMKYDYYNHTNVFKPGYNIQMGISDGYIRHVYISADPNDVRTYIPFMNGYFDAYGEYPDKTPADAGYGSYDNYCFCRMNHIKLFMKYPGQDKQKEKITDKNRFKTWAFPKDEDDNLICPAGHVFQTVSTRIEQRGVYPKIVETQETGHCDGCPLRSQCTKSKYGRRISRTRQLEKLQSEVRDNMAADGGYELMMMRSEQSEGNFGNMKANWGFDKLHRKGTSNVKTEVLMVSIGINLRRLQIRKFGRKKEDLLAITA